MRSLRLISALALLFCCLSVQAEELLTNATHFADKPKWLTAGRVNRIAENIQRLLEWDIHRVEVVWHHDQAEFERFHGLGPLAMAISRKKDNSVHLGPKVNETNFDQIFGHELVHVISYQKYKEAIPPWLEEGLANFLSKNGKVDYKWLATHPFPNDVRDLTHPFNGNEDFIRYHYLASQALAEMIASKCDLTNLLRLSVGMKMEPYLDTYCRIPDLNAAFHKWVTEKK